MAGVTTLGADCASDDTSITVVDASQLKESELLLIDDEIVIATAFPGEGQVDVTRGVDQTEGAAHLTDADVYPVVHVAHGGAGITVYYKDSDGSVKARTIVTVAPAIGNVRVLGEPSGAGESLVSLSDTEADWGTVSTPVQQATYSGFVHNIINGGLNNMTWDTLGSGSDLLDRSTPALPKFLAAGTYALTLQVQGAPLTEDGYAFVSLEIANNSFSQQYSNDKNYTVIAAVLQVEADDEMQVTVNNHDGAATRGFNLTSAIIVKLA